MTPYNSFSILDDSSSAQNGNLKCAVIIPVGPGHETLVGTAQASVAVAFSTSRGPFTHVIVVPMPDLAGEYGRSRRRNDGIDYALANDLDWIFFLDADDVMAPHTFAAASSYIQDYDAIFGMIAESRLDTPGQMKIRENQLGPTTSIHDILQHDPFLTLQMGHFVRTKAAAEIRFDTSLDAGEDFKYYLELWSRYRCAKINHVLFINRRGSHSTGPRSADGGAWRNVVTRLISEFNSHHTAESK